MQVINLRIYCVQLQRYNSARQLPLTLVLNLHTNCVQLQLQGTILRVNCFRLSICASIAFNVSKKVLFCASIAFGNQSAHRLRLALAISYDFTLALVIRYDFAFCDSDGMFLRIICFQRSDMFLSINDIERYGMILFGNLHFLHVSCLYHNHDSEPHLPLAARCDFARPLHLTIRYDSVYQFHLAIRYNYAHKLHFVIRYGYARKLHLVIR